METGYSLVHIITSGEYKAPLLATQVFERAQMEATIQGSGKPDSVQVWIILPMREAYFDKNSKIIIDKLRSRCPDVQIKLVGGIGRINNWPRKALLKKFRNSIKGRVVYHCRGESSLYETILLRKLFPQDRFILDIRGYWPMEKFVDEDIYFIKDMTADQKERYGHYKNRLQSAMALADRVCTVSRPLRNYLIRHDNASESTVVIPCCVKETIPGANRDKIRKELNLENKIALLYLGGTQKYQNLEEMVIPFFKSAIAQSDRAVGVFITQNKGKMEAMLQAGNIDMDKVRLLSVSQDLVGDYLSAMDMGILFRVPSDLKDFYQPVKFGEYLSAGLPVILEEGTGEIGDYLDKYKIGFVVKLAGKATRKEMDTEVAETLRWYADNEKTVGDRARQYVDTFYTWKANIETERNMYLDALKDPAKN